jgi:hypothetical protein
MKDRMNTAPLPQKEYEERKLFLEQLQILSRNEQEEIFRIIKRNNEIWSENSNGIFFDVASLQENTFRRLQEFIQFCLENRREQDERIRQMNELRAEAEAELIAQGTEQRA